MCRMSNGSPRDGPHPVPLLRIVILAEARRTGALQDRRLSRSVDLNDFSVGFSALVTPLVFTMGVS